MLKGTVTTALKLDIKDMVSAHEVWGYCENLENFSQAIMSARQASISFTPFERARLFASSILSYSFRLIINEFNNLPMVDRTWTKLLTIYNAESTRRRVKPLPRTGGRGGMVMAVEGKKGQRLERKVALEGKGKKGRRQRSVECGVQRRLKPRSKPRRIRTNDENGKAMVTTDVADKAVFDTQSAWAGVMISLEDQDPWMDNGSINT